MASTRRRPEDEASAPREGDDWLTGATGATMRTRAADHVFVQLAGAILRGQLAPNQPLPPERDLATRFDISRVLVREAIHRLKELGLVRVKQGGQTTVLDPDDATDPRVMALSLELAPPDGAAARDLGERHLAQAIVLLELAEHRMSSADVVALEELVDAYTKKGAAWATQFVSQYWSTVARATKNRILARETRWWLDIAATPGLEKALTPLAHDKSVALYQETTARLRRRGDAAGHFREAVRSVLHASR